MGVRVFEKRYKVGVVNSTTLEEANNEPFNWIRQRSRWIKGYMQTLLVHMRNPPKLVGKIGWRGFFGFNFFVGFTPITFFNILLALVISGRYILANPWPETQLGVAYLILSWLGHFSFVGFIALS